MFYTQAGRQWATAFRGIAGAVAQASNPYIFSNLDEAEPAEPRRAVWGLPR